jgi:hypothetical protein
VNSLSAGLSTYDIGGLTAVVSSLLTAPDMATSVTYQTNAGARSYDPGSGTSSYAEEPTVLSGWLSPLTLDQVAKVDGAVLGDVQFLIPLAALPSAPATDDRFTVGTALYRLYRVIRGPLATHWCAFAHRAP